VKYTFGAGDMKVKSRKLLTWLAKFTIGHTCKGKKVSYLVQ
jgi:hypothetical protein